MNLPTAQETEAEDVVLGVVPLGFPWPTLYPFLACIHHDDAYPAGDANLAPPTTSLAGRQLGQDFDPKNLEVD